MNTWQFPECLLVQDTEINENLSLALVVTNLILPIRWHNATQCIYDSEYTKSLLLNSGLHTYTCLYTISESSLCEGEIWIHLPDIVIVLIPFYVVRGIRAKEG